MVSLSANRVQLRQYFDSGHANCKVTAANLTKKDGSLAKFEADYYYPNIPVDRLFVAHGLDIVFLIYDFGTDPVTSGESGPIYRMHRLGVCPVVFDKESDGAGTVSINGRDLLDKALDETYTVLDAYYSSDDKITGRGIPETRPLTPEVIYATTVEVFIKTYMFAVATGTEHIQRWLSLKIGKDANNYAELTDGLLNFTYTPIRPGYRQFTANPVTSSDLTLGHLNYTFEILLSGDYRAMFWATDVSVAGGSQYALVSKGDPNKIEYMTVSAKLRMGDGTAKTRVYTLEDAYILGGEYRGGNLFAYLGDAEDISYVDS